MKMLINDYDKLEKALLTKNSFTEDGYRHRFRDFKPVPVIRLNVYLAKWLELAGSSSGIFDALVDFIVKEQFINACSNKLAMSLLKTGPKDLIELTA